MKIRRLAALFDRRYENRLAFLLAMVFFLVVLAIPERPRRGGHRVSRAKGDARSLATSVARLRADTGAANVACLGNFDHLLEREPPSVCMPDGYTGINLPHCSQLLPAQAGAICWGGPYISVELRRIPGSTTTR